jgi:hypothetical protein
MLGRSGALRLLAQIGLPSHDSLVLRDLVRRGAGPLFRCEPTDLAHFAGAQRDHRMRPAPEHARGNARRASGALGRLSTFSHALLRVQFLCSGERARFFSDLFAQVGGNADRSSLMRAVLRIDCSDQAAQGLLLMEGRRLGRRNRRSSFGFVPTAPPRSRQAAVRHSVFHAPAFRNPNAIGRATC